MIINGRVVYNGQHYEASELILPSTLKKESNQLSLISTFLKAIALSSLYLSGNINLDTFAYTITTSGTSSKNFKTTNVKVPYSTLLKNLDSIKTRLNLSNNFSSILVSNETFDPFFIEILLPLTNNGTLHLIEKPALLSPSTFLSFLINSKVTLLSLTPSLFARFSISQQQTLFNESSIQDLIFGGEEFPFEHLKQHFYNNTNVKKRIRVWNIYGTTECSVWASLTRVDFESSGFASIGDALDDTLMFVLPQDFEKGEFLKLECESEVLEFVNTVKIMVGIGELWIGGKCIVGDEKDLDKCPLIRATGDLVKRFQNGSIKYLGRLTNIIKKSGFRISLDEVNSVIYRTFKFANATQSDVVFVNGIIVGFVVAADVDFQKLEIQRHFRKELPFYAIPERIIFIDQLPMTINGKVDGKCLNKIYLNNLYDKFISLLPEAESLKLFDFDSIKIFILSLFKNTLLTSIEKLDDFYFLAEGGNSMDAVRLSNIILAQFKRENNQVDQTRLQQAILNCSMTAIINHVLSISLQSTIPDDNDEIPSYINQKRRKIETQTSFQNDKLKSTQIFSRGMTIKTKSKPKIIINPTLLAKIDLQKCIDSAPLIVTNTYERYPHFLPSSSFFSNKKQTLIFSTSHSGIIQCSTILKTPTTTIQTLWQTTLQNRIESSPLYIPSTTSICIGCYDGAIYFLSASTGTVLAKVQTGDMVKSTAVLNEKRVYIGSYDKSIYILDDTGVLLQRVWVGGAVFGEVYILGDFFWCGGLNGELVKFFLGGEEVWRCKVGKALFGSVRGVGGGGVVVGGVDGLLVRLDLDGNKVWEVDTGGPIFTSPVSILSTHLLVGSHSGKLFFINSENGHKNVLDVGHPIYGMPFLNDELICVVNIKGEVFIEKIDDLKFVERRLEPKLFLNGDCFSSPILFWEEEVCYLVVGCRDNNIYVYQL